MLLPLLSAAYAADPDPLLRPEDRVAVLQALAAADLTTVDLMFQKDYLQADGVRRDAWRLPGIEGLLHNPMSVPSDAARFSGGLSEAAGNAEAALLAMAVAQGTSLSTAAVPVPVGPDCTPDRGLAGKQLRAWKRLDPSLRAAVCELAAAAARKATTPSVVAGRDLDTLLTLLRPDGEEAWDATESQDRVRSLLAALKSREPLQLRAFEAHRVVSKLARVEAALLGVPSEAWPTERLDLLFGGHAIQLGSTGTDSFTAAFTLDPGGDDRYTLEASPLAVHLDLAGADLWTGGDGTLGGTIGGVSVLVDVAGNDIYRAGAASLGAGVAGVGILVDRAGDDSYRGTATAQGAGFAGIGLLLDGGGSDTYDAQAYAQGYAGVLGVGALWDAGGDDMYRAGGTFGDMAMRLPEHTLSLSQGFSIGLRPDAGGGLGLLVDDGGNDAYVADLFAQGCSYWFSRGYLVDRTGNDRYNMYQYGQGSGIHLSVGGIFDLEGDDAYTAGHLAQGSSHDLSVGWLVDRMGDDIYAAYSVAQGGSLTNSATFFVDAAGDDSYVARLHPSRGAGRFDRNRGSIGVFVDASGEDRYDDVGPGNEATLRSWAYGIGVDGIARLPPPDPEPTLPLLHVLRDPLPVAPSTRPPVSRAVLDDLARADSVSCETPPSCAEHVAQLAEGGPDAFARLLPALPRDVLREGYTLDAVLRAVRSPENDPKLHATLLSWVTTGPVTTPDRWAIRWLGELGVDPVGTAAALAPLAESRDPRLREALATAILAWKIAPPLLDRLAADPDEGVRAVTALALGAGGAPLSRLSPLLLDPNALVRFDAASALVARPPESTRPLLLALWRADSFPTPAARRLVLELLARVGGKDAMAIVKAVARQDDDPWAQRKAADVLAGETRFGWRP